MRPRFCFASSSAEIRPPLSLPKLANETVPGARRDTEGGVQLRKGGYGRPLIFLWSAGRGKGSKRSARESPGRLDAVRRAFQAAGAELKEFYLVMGQHVMVVVSEAPDDETVTRLALTTGSQGAARTDTLRAFTEDEYRKIIAALP